MATPFDVHVVTPDREVWSGQASFVIARSAAGDLGILAGHEPVLSVLEIGVIRIERVGEQPLVAAVDGGFLSVGRRPGAEEGTSTTRVDILAEHVTLEADIKQSDLDAMERKAEALRDSGNETAARAETAKAAARRRIS